MSINKAPAYQWYPKDILASVRVAEMSAEEECWYRRALDFCWVNGSLPADAKRCSRIIGKGCTVKGAEAVLRMFVSNKKNPDEMIHDRQEVERKKQVANRKEKSKAGKASAEKRKKQKELEAEAEANRRATDVEIPLQQNPTLQSSSSSSTSVSFPEEENTEADVCVFDQSDEYEQFQDEILSGLRSDFKLNTIRDEQGWVRQIEWAFLNEFSATGFLECFRLMRQQTWRKGRITPENVADNLPDLAKLREAVRSQASENKPIPFDPGKNTGESTYVPPEPCGTCGDEFCMTDHRYDKSAA